MSDSTCICPEEALRGEWVTKPWNQSIQARISHMRELRDRYCGYKGSILKLCTGALSRLNSVKQLKRGEEYDSIRAVVESCVLVAL